MNKVDFRISIPAKCFLMGEYAVLDGHDALILTNMPAFTFLFASTLNPTKNPFHLKSPAGKFWQKHKEVLQDYNVFVSDPYKGIGGGGLSSAEFIAVWTAFDYLNSGAKESFSINKLFLDYLTFGSKSGIRHSGADVLAQVTGGLAHVHSQSLVDKVTWPFVDLDVVLIHTLKHCQTAKHLATSPKVPWELKEASDFSIQSFLHGDFVNFIKGIERFVGVQYQHKLLNENSWKYINQYIQVSGVFAAKGCGAMGEDVIAVFCHKNSVHAVQKKAIQDGLVVLSSSRSGASSFGVFKNIGDEFELF